MIAAIRSWFDFEGRETNFGREIAGGFTTFAAMAYILAVNPQILSIDTGMDRAALITATALASAIGTFLMALLTNYPIALAPGMGLNALFTFEICGELGVPWEGALGMVFWNGILFLLLAVTGFRSAVVKAIPESLKTGMQVGIGLLIALFGLENAGIVIDDPATLVGLGELSDGVVPNAATLTLLGVILIAVLMWRKIPGAILIVVGVVTVIGLFVPGSESEPGGAASALTQLPDGGLLAAPASLGPLFLKADLLYPLKNWQLAWVPVVTLIFVDLFDSIGTLIGVSRRAGLTNKAGNLPKMGRALTADAAATTAGALLGTSPVTSYVESAAGVEAGGRTGFTGVIVSICFLLALFFHPLIGAIPAAATAPALIVIGVFMVAGLKDFDWSDIRLNIAAVATMMLIPFGFGIADGIAVGCVLYTAMMVLTGDLRRVHWLMYGLAVLFVLKFVFVRT